MVRNLKYPKGIPDVGFPYHSQFISLASIKFSVLMEISSSLFRYKVSTERHMHRLMIQTVRMSDAGEYSVVAGSSVSKATLTVEGKDVRISEPAEKEITVSTKIYKKKNILFKILFTDKQ